MRILYVHAPQLQTQLALLYDNAVFSSISSSLGADLVNAPLTLNKRFSASHAGMESEDECATGCLRVFLGCFASPRATSVYKIDLCHVGTGCIFFLFLELVWRGWGGSEGEGEFIPFEKARQSVRPSPYFCLFHVVAVVAVV